MEDKPWNNPNGQCSLEIRINNKLETDGADPSGNILPDPKAGGAGDGLKGLVNWNLMKF